MPKSTGRPRSSTPGPISREPLPGRCSATDRGPVAMEKPAGAGVATSANADVALRTSPSAATSTNRQGLKVKDASKEVRMGFIRKVYSLLTAQLLLTTLIAAPLQMVSTEWLVDHFWLVWGSLAAMVVVLLAMLCVERYAKTYPTNYIMLFSFTVFSAVLVGVCSAMYTAGSVCVCFATTVLIFVGLTAYAWKTESDFTGMGPYLSGALVSLLCFSFVIGTLVCFGIHIPGINAVYCALGVLTFVFYIIFDTQCIIGEYKGHKHQFSIDDYVFAALNLYLDILDLFLELLKIMGEKKKK